MRYRQDACYKCELPSCDAVAFKIHVQYLWNEAQILTSSSGAVYSSEKSMVQRGNSWTMSEMFSSSMLLASTCTPQCDHSRDTESTLPVGSCTPGMGGVQRVLLGKISAWVASSSEIFPADGIALKLPRLHQGSAFGALQRGSCTGWDRFLFPLGLACWKCGLWPVQAPGTRLCHS